MVSLIRSVMETLGEILEVLHILILLAIDGEEYCFSRG